jgi:protein O-mannosyl-transferase
LEWRRPRCLLLLLLLSTAVVFCHAFASSYLVWDDDAFIRDNLIYGLDFTTAVSRSFSSFFLGDYLPLTLLSYWAEIKLFGFNAALQHTTNLLLHLANIALLFTVLRRQKHAAAFALTVAALFALHPLQTEVAMWVSERKSLLSVFLMLLAMLCSQAALRARRPRLLYGLCIALFAASLLCKATCIALPFILILGDWAYEGMSLTQATKRHLPLFLLVPAEAVVRLMAHFGSLQSAPMTATLDWLLPLRALNALSFYLEKYFLPVDLSPIYPNFNQWHYPSLHAQVFVLALAVVAYAWSKSRDRSYLYFGALFLLFLAPVLQIIPRGNYVNDRYMYVPIIGLTSIVLLLVRDLGRSPKGEKLEPTALALLVVSALGVASYERSKAWVDNTTFWKDAVKKAAFSAIPYENLAVEYYADSATDPDKLTLATSLLEQAIAIKGGDEIAAYNALAAVYGDKLKNDEKAESLLKQAIDLYPGYFDTFLLRLNLGRIQERRQRPSEAAATFSQLIADVEARNDSRLRSTLEAAKDRLAAIRAIRAPESP